MQSLWNKTKSNPLGERYWSCVPYLLGEGQQYFVNMDYVPSNTKVTSPLKAIRIVQTNPARALDESGKWLALFESTVVRRR